MHARGRLTDRWLLYDLEPLYVLEVFYVLDNVHIPAQRRSGWATNVCCRFARHSGQGGEELLTLDRWWCRGKMFDCIPIKSIDFVSR